MHRFPSTLTEHERFHLIMSAIDDLLAVVTQIQASVSAVDTAIKDLVSKLGSGDTAAIEGAVANLQAANATLAADANLDPAPAVVTSSVPATTTPEAAPAS